MKLCPECGTVNPPIRVSSSGTHLTEKCKAVIGTRKGFFGETNNIYCDFIGYWDEDDDWHYVRIEKDGKIILVKESDFHSIRDLKNIFLNAERKPYKYETI